MSHGFVVKGVVCEPRTLDEMFCAIVSQPLQRQFGMRGLLNESVQTQDYVEAALTTAVQIHLDEPVGGDVLVFLTGQEEIESAEVALNKRARLLPATASKLVVCSIFAALDAAKQCVPPTSFVVLVPINSLTFSSVGVCRVKRSAAQRHHAALSVQHVVLRFCSCVR